MESVPTQSSNPNLNSVLLKLLTRMAKKYIVRPLFRDMAEDRKVEIESTGSVPSVP
jgi:hypothetical protein